MRPDFATRLGTPSDAACLAALGSQVWLHTYATQGIRPTIANYVHEHLSPAAFRRHLERSDAFTLIAEVDGHLVGFAIGEVGKPCIAPSPASTHLDKLYVQEHFMGLGIGYGLLLKARTEAARCTGTPGLWLTVNSKNELARNFYTRQGFTEIGVSQFELYGERHDNRILHAPDA